MADLNLKVGDYVELRSGEIVGPLRNDGHLTYPWDVDTNVNLSWTEEGRFSSVSSGYLDIVRVVAIKTAAIGSDEQPAPQQSDDKIAILHYSDTVDEGKIKLLKYPEGYTLWYHGQQVWKSWEPVEIGAMCLQIDERELYHVIRMAVENTRQCTTGLGTVAVQIRNAVVDALHRMSGEIPRDVPFQKQGDAPKSEGGPSDTSGFNPQHIHEMPASSQPRWNVCGGATEPMRLFDLDDIDPITRAFLQSLYPSAPLRAIEVSHNAETATIIEVSFGRPMNTEKTVELKISTAVPVWVQ